MPHSPCMQALHFRQRTRLRRAPDTMGDTVDLTGVGRGAGFMVCGLVMGMVGRRTRSRAWSFSCQQGERELGEGREVLCSAGVWKALIPGFSTTTSDNVRESSSAPSALCSQRCLDQHCPGTSPGAHSLIPHTTPHQELPFL